MEAYNRAIAEEGKEIAKHLEGIKEIDF